jgi:hypothetical protein
VVDKIDATLNLLWNQAQVGGATGRRRLRQLAFSIGDDAPSAAARGEHAIYEWRHPASWRLHEERVGTTRHFEANLATNFQSISILHQSYRNRPIAEIPPIQFSTGPVFPSR